ncbi:MAG: glycosyltransferase family 4 protein [Puniceicoccales bacterium]
MPNDSRPRIALIGDKPVDFGGSVVSNKRMSTLLDDHVEMIPISLEVSLRESDWSGRVEKFEWADRVGYRIYSADFKVDRSLSPFLGEAMLNYDLRRRSWAERLLAICREEKVTAIHVYGGFEQRAFIGAYAATLLDVPLVITYIGQDLEARIFGKHLAQTVQAVQGARLITCKSEHAHRIITGLLRPTCPVEIIRNSTSLSNFDPQAQIEPWGDRPVIGCFAEFRRVVGLDTLLKAYGKLTADGHRFTLALGGPFRETEVGYFNRMIEALPEEARVWQMGRVPHKKMLAALRACDVSIAPSFADTSPYKVLETMLAQVPLVATTAGGIPDLVTHGKEALLVPPGDSDAMAAAILRIMEDRPLREKMIQAAYQKVTTEFTREIELERWTSVYRAAGLCS